MSGVHLFLVTGSDEQLADFHLHACMVLSGIERREQTVLYACFSENRQLALNAAVIAGVTVQEWSEEAREWRNIAGSGPGWSDSGSRT